MLFAWKWSASKRSEEQDEDDWFLLHVINQLFYKARMHWSLPQQTVRSHLIYTFQPDNMRPYYSMESDYSATCSVSRKNHLLVDNI